MDSKNSLSILFNFSNEKKKCSCLVPKDPTDSCLQWFFNCKLDLAQNEIKENWIWFYARIVEGSHEWLWKSWIARSATVVNTIACTLL